MDETPNLNLPYIMAAQAQKHVTHNEAIRKLDAFIQLSVKDRDLTVPPGSPVDGDRYILGASATGDWAGKDNQIAAYQDNIWMFYQPREGWLCWLDDEDKLVSWDGTGWIDISADTSEIQNANHVGINATADDTNRLSVKSDAVLFSHDDVTPGTGDIQTKLNKATSGDTASFLFQTNWSGRVEMGLTGNDDFHFKSSPDGSTWKEALVVDKDTGAVSSPNTPGREILTANRTYFVRTDGNDGNDGLSNTAGSALLTVQKGVDEVAALDLGGFTCTIQVGDGTYTATVALKNVVGGSAYIVGNSAAPANVTIQRIDSVSVAGTWVLEDFQVGGGGSTGIFISNGYIEFSGLDFASVSSRHIVIASLGYIKVTGNYTISSGATRHCHVYNNGVYDFESRTVTISGTPNYSIAYVYCNLGAAILCSNSIFSGSATGKRYHVEINGSIATGGGGASFFPGDVAGTTATGGIYA